jgi:hypothetical protein
MDLELLKPNEPKYQQVTLPKDITDLSSEQLAEMFTALTIWADYLASQLAEAQIKERNAKNKLDFEENTQLVRRMGSAVKGERVTLVKAQIATDPKVVGLSDSYEETYAYRKILEMLVNNHDRDLALVSREITRRTSDQRAMRRDYNTL